MLSGSNLEDEEWISGFHRLASSTGNEAFGQASAPCVVGAQCQSDGNTGQLVNGLSGMCTAPGGMSVWGGKSRGNVGPSCLGNPGCASLPS